MPELVAFTQEEPELIVKSEDGLVRVGKVAVKTRYRFILFSFVVIVLMPGADLFESRDLLTFLIFCIALVLAAFADHLLPSRLIVTLDSGDRLEIPVDRALPRKARVGKPQADPMSFRPSVTVEGQTLVELRSDWRDSGWEIYIPATVASESVAEHLHNHLPYLDSAIALST